MTGHSIDPKTAKQWLDSGEAVLIDVREPSEYAAEHIPQAQSVPLSELGTHLPPSPQKRIFHCQKGKRGEQACAVVEGEKWNIEGGIEAWKAAGLSTIGAVAAPIPIMRQVQIGAGGFVLLAVLAGYAGFPAGFALAGVFGAMLMLAGISGWCGMAILLGKMPWNNRNS